MNLRNYKTSDIFMTLDFVCGKTWKQLKSQIPRRMKNELKKHKNGGEKLKAIFKGKSKKHQSKRYFLLHYVVFTFIRHFECLDLMIIKKKLWRRKFELNWKSGYIFSVDYYIIFFDASYFLFFTLKQLYWKKFN